MEKFRHLLNRLFFKFLCVKFLTQALLLSLLFLPALVHAQSDTLKQIQLKEITLVEKSLDKTFSNSIYSLGTQLMLADSSTLSQLQNNSLSDYLQGQAGVFLKESGNGMLSTISLRGTASSHTAVSWNGLTINPLTMGQVDFSQLPLFFFDKVGVHAGGESALYGNGAIGGSIVLGSASDYKKKWSAQLQETVGSFDYTFTGLKVQGGTDKWQSKTALMYNACANDFEFKQATLVGDKIEKQQNAAFYNYGFLEELSFRLSPKNELLLHAWHNFFYREIQPSMQNNTDTAAYDNLSNRNTILMAVFKHKSRYAFDARLAYIDDYQLNLGDVIASSQLIGGFDFSRAWRKFSFKSGASAQYILPRVYSYAADVREWRGDMYLLTRYDFNAVWKLSCNLRQAFVTDIAVPFTPSVGLETRLLHIRNQSMFLRFNTSRSYKVPTLNDRYWGGLDNRYLLPEDGFNNEAGLEYNISKKSYNLHALASLYYNRVQNWIMWMPRGDIWKPQNIDLVEAKGLELYLKQSVQLAKNNLSLSLNYAHTRSIILEGFADMTPFKGRQMPLLPEHTAGGELRFDNSRFYIQTNCVFVGLRATSNIFDIMSAYTLFNASSGYNFKIHKQILALSVQANNLFNITYQTVPYKAMPLQHWKLTLKYIL